MTFKIKNYSHTYFLPRMYYECLPEETEWSHYNKLQIRDYSDTDILHHPITSVQYRVFINHVPRAITQRTDEPKTREEARKKLF